MRLERTVWAAMILLQALLGGCASSNRAITAPDAQALPLLPPDHYEAPVQAWRDASAFTITLFGNESTQYSAGAVPDPGSDTMQLAAPAAGSAWALYSFTGLALDDVPSLIEITLTSGLPEEHWIGLGDYAIDSWRWIRVEPEGTDGIDATELLQPVSSTGNFHVIVLVYGGAQARLALLKLYINGQPPQPPTHVVAEPGAQAGEYVLSWARAGTATGYEIYRDTQSSAFDTVGDVDTWTDTAAGEQDRTYWLKAVNEHGTSGFSQPAYAQAGAWQIQLIDPDGRYSTSLAVVDGKPVIAYVAVVVDMVTTPYPRFARATTSTPSGADDWVITEWNEWGEAVNQTHIPWVAEVGGKPAFTIANRYYRALIPAPSSRDDWEMHLFDAEADIAGPVPLVEYNGVPCIVFIDQDLDALRFARGLSVAPSSGIDWDISTIDEFDVVNPGEYCLAEINNLLAISYGRRDGIEESGDLYFAYATTPSPSGSGDWQTHIVDDIPGYPAGASEVDLISLSNGKPVISYIESYAPDYIGLKFARSLVMSPSGPSDWITHTVQSNITYGGVGSSMQLVEGKPTICYFDGEGIKYAAAQVAEPSSSSDWTVEALLEGHVIDYKCLRILSGQPAVSYCSSTGLFLLTRSE